MCGKSAAQKTKQYKQKTEQQQTELMLVMLTGIFLFKTSILPIRARGEKQMQWILKGLPRPRAMQQQLLLSSFSILENLSQQESANFFFFSFLCTASESQHVRLWTILHCRECFAEIAWQDCQKDYLLIFFVLGFISSNNGARKEASPLKTEFIHESYAVKLS